MLGTNRRLVVRSELFLRTATKPPKETSRLAAPRGEP